MTDIDVIYVGVKAGSGIVQHIRILFQFITCHARGKKIQICEYIFGGAE